MSQMRPGPLGPLECWRGGAWAVIGNAKWPLPRAKSTGMCKALRHPLEPRTLLASAAWAADHVGMRPAARPA